MKDKPVRITENDMQQLRKLIFLLKSSRYPHPEALNDLENGLNRSEVVSSSEMAKDVVVMNSRVCLEDVDTNRKETLTLVFPDQANMEQSKVSVLAPVGMAMLGHQTGDVFESKVPAGIRRLKIKMVQCHPADARDRGL
ncbi:MAG: GreA/GreB family elongation factor [Verrucomicrobiae bacterium]|nr:GreA/GreB family elongation factor [Verrucomicrobiae bacterium]